MKIAVFPGSFDPFTIGHHEIVLRAVKLFDKIIVAIGQNSDKKTLFPLETRISSLEKLYSSVQSVEIHQYEGLTVDFCKKVNASFILRGLRIGNDFEYERAIAQMNRNIYPEVETVFLVCDPQYSAVSSSIVRDIYRHGGNISKFMPPDFAISH